MELRLPLEGYLDCPEYGDESVSVPCSTLLSYLAFLELGLERKSSLKHRSLAPSIVVLNSELSLEWKTRSARSCMDFHMKRIRGRHLCLQQ